MKRFKYLLSLLLCLTVLSSGLIVFPAQAQTAETTVSGLKTEYMVDPLGIDTAAPRLSWTMDSDIRAQRQTAYQIVVSKDKAAAEQGEGEIWDTGKVTSAESNNIPYAGKALESKTRYYWSVRVWDRDGKVTPYAPAAYFETAMLDSSDWTAQWITTEDETAALYPYVSIDISPVSAKYIKLDCTKLGVPLQNDGCRLQLAEIEAYTPEGQNVALNATVTSNDNFSNGWWEPEFLVDGERSSGTGQNGFTSNGHAGANTNIWVELELEQVQTIDRIVIYARNDERSGERGTVNFPQSYTIQTAGENKQYTVQHTAENQPSPEFMEYDPALPVFGKTFTLNKTVKSARAYASGLGMFELNINGQTVTDAVFEPGETNFDKRALYVTYDITDLLKNGENTVGAYLGKGFYYNPATPGRYNRSPKIWGPLMLLVQIEVEYSDGTTAVIGTDTSWKYTKGPLTESSWLGGEDYDATRELTGFGEEGYAYSGWKSARVASTLPFSELSARMYPSVRPTEQLTDITVTDLGNGRYVADFGINFAGHYTFTGTLAAGQKIEFWPGETLNDDGSVSQQSIGNGPVWDSYTAAGGEMSYTPKFVYHGFRYLEIRGLDSAPDKSQLTGNIIHCDNEETGSFDTSDPVINQIHTLITRSIADNMYNVLTDCPHREKLGWMEVTQLLYNSVAANYDVAAWYQNISNMTLDAQKDYGSFPSVVPPLTAGHGAHMLSPGPDDTPNDPTWCGAGVLVPWYSYLTYGNLDQLIKAYPSLVAYMDYLGSLVEKNEPYILENTDVNRDLGDWYSEEYTSVTFVISCTYYQLCDIMRRIAGLTGNTSDAESYAELADLVKNAINAKFFDASKLSYDSGSQTANGMPLYFGIVPDEYRDGVLENLVESVKSRDYHLSSGEVGLKYVLGALSDNGYADVAYRMVTNRTLPSYYYLAAIGKTSLTEPWDGRTTDSQNHCMLGHGDGWLYEYLGGLRNNGAAYDKSIIAPYIPDDLDSADVSIGTPYGQLRCAWTRDGGNITLDAYVPANTTSTVYIPAKDLSVVTEGEKMLEEADGILSVSFENGTAVIEVGSGHYQFASQRAETLYPEELTGLISAAKSLKKENVARHYIALQNAVAQAEAVLGSATTQAELDSAYNALSDVLSAMQFKNNLALDKPASASSSIENNDWSVSKLTDGDRVNGTAGNGCGYSSSSDEYSPHSEWVMIDLLAVSEFNRIELYPRSFTGEVYTFPKDFTIEVSADGEIWETVVKETDYPVVSYGDISFEFDSTAARYVRLSAETLRPNPADTGRYRLQLAEFEVYNDIPQTIEAAAENAKANLSDLAADISLSDTEIMDAVTQGIANSDIRAKWTAELTRTDASYGRDGHITGEITLYFEDKTEAISIDILIPAESVLPGDLDLNGVVNVADIIMLKSLIMNGEWSDRDLAVGDMDGNKTLNVSDMLAVKNIIMRG